MSEPTTTQHTTTATATASVRALHQSTCLSDPSAVPAPSRETASNVAASLGCWFLPLALKPSQESQTKSTRQSASRPSNASKQKLTPVPPAKQRVACKLGQAQRTRTRVGGPPSFLTIEENAWWIWRIRKRMRQHDDSNGAATTTATASNSIEQQAEPQQGHGGAAANQPETTSLTAT